MNLENHLDDFGRRMKVKGKIAVKSLPKGLWKQF